MRYRRTIPRRAFGPIRPKNRAFSDRLYSGAEAPQPPGTCRYAVGPAPVSYTHLSVAYWNCRFPHKKKVFVAYSEGEFDAILAAIYSSSYQDHLIIQEFIPGDDSHMRVMNVYCGTDHKVRLTALGQALLEEHSPEGIGSYAAILSITDEALTKQMTDFLEDIGYIGFANFDMKYDSRDGTYKLFEMNPRQGRCLLYTSRCV